MKTTTSITVFTLLVGLACAKIIKTIRPANKECCKVAYDDNEEAQSVCLKEIEKELKHSYIAKGFRHALKKIENEEANKKIDEFSKTEENAKKLSGLKNPDAITEFKNSIYTKNQDVFREALNAAKQHQVNDMIGVMNPVCKKVSQDIAKKNDPEFFSTELFGFIVASGTGQFQMEDWEPFIKYLEDNKEDIERIKSMGANFWQMMFALDKNMVNFITTCECKDTVLSEGFHYFLEWIVKQKSHNPTFKVCTLEKIVDVYHEQEEKIAEDPEQIRDSFVEAMNDC